MVIITQRRPKSANRHHLDASKIENKRRGTNKNGVMRDNKGTKTQRTVHQDINTHVRYGDDRYRIERRGPRQ